MRLVYLLGTPSSSIDRSFDNLAAHNARCEAQGEPERHLILNSDGICGLSYWFMKLIIIQVVQEHLRNFPRASR
jgi:hypothetical protein